MGVYEGALLRCTTPRRSPSPLHPPPPQCSALIYESMFGSGWGFRLGPVYLTRLCCQGESRPCLLVCLVLSCSRSLFVAFVLRIMISHHHHHYHHHHHLPHVCAPCALLSDGVVSLLSRGAMYGHAFEAFFSSRAPRYASRARGRVLSSFLATSLGHYVIVGLSWPTAWAECWAGLSTRVEALPYFSLVRDADRSN